MGNPNDKQVLLVGLPGAGKTSFIAALWHVVNAEDVPGALKLFALGGDDTYLNQIMESWITFQPVLRTTQQDEKVPTLQLEEEITGNRCVLSVPDLSGETYRRQWVDREWSEAYEANVRSCDALLVFIHPEQKLEAAEITPALRMIPQALREEISSEDTDPVVWDAEKAAGVVQLVDVLQFISKAVPRPVRTAVVISAWDLLERQFSNPENFVAQRLPFLEQYLSTNAETFSYKAFGLSALGVALEDQAQKTAFQEMVKTASERINVVHGGLSTHDITLPLKWALGWESSAQGAP